MLKRNEVFVGYSRDGFIGIGPTATAFLPVTDDKNAWNAANVQSCGGGCVTVGDELYFYCSGRRIQAKNVVSTGLATICAATAFASSRSTCRMNWLRPAANSSTGRSASTAVR